MATGSDRGDEDVVVASQYDWSETKPSTALVEMIAAAKECEPRNIDPLFLQVDPDAIDTLLLSGDPNRATDVSVSLSFDGYTVTVRRDGEITVAEPTE